MFYIQTQDGDLPYIYKVYVRILNAQKAAERFMNENEQAGVISVCTALHETKYSYVRQINGGNIVEEIHDPENPGEYEEVYHGYSIDLDRERDRSKVAALCV